MININQRDHHQLCTSLVLQAGTYPKILRSWVLCCKGGLWKVVSVIFNINMLGKIFIKNAVYRGYDLGVVSISYSISCCAGNAPRPIPLSDPIITGLPMLQWHVSVLDKHAHTPCTYWRLKQARVQQCSVHYLVPKQSCIM